MELANIGLDSKPLILSHHCHWHRSNTMSATALELVTEFYTKRLDETVSTPPIIGLSLP